MRLSIFPPDPHYDAESAANVLSWTVFETSDRNAEGVTHLATKSQWLAMADHPLMQRDFAKILPKEAEIHDFLRQHFKALSFLGDLELAELEQLTKLITESQAFKSSRKVMNGYVSDVIDDVDALRPIEEHSALFFASFLEQYLLVPTRERQQLLTREARLLTRARKMA